MALVLLAACLMGGLVFTLPQTIHEWQARALSDAIDQTIPHEALAEIIGVSSQRLSHWRHGREPIGARITLATLDKDGMKFYCRYCALQVQYLGEENMRTIPLTQEQVL